MRPTFLLLCALSILGIAGCFETSLSLGPASGAKADPAYCGNWDVRDKDHPDQPPGVHIIIRNLDGKQYYVEWIESGKDGEPSKSQRMIGYTVDVKGVSFAQLRDLPEDGSIPDKHLVMRVALKDSQLVLRNLDDKFFKDKTLQADADFRRLVEENLDNAAMYDEGEIVASRAPAK